MSQEKLHDSLGNADSADLHLEQAAAQIRDAEPDPQVVAEASSRVWTDLLKQGARRGMKVVTDDDLESNVAAFGRRAKQTTSAPRRGGQRWGLWALAAALLIGVGLAQILVREMWPSGPSAEVVTVDGQLFRVSSASQVPIAPGMEISEHDVIRTGRTGSAVVRLQDGSLVELRERSELSIDESRGGTTLELARGSVIVEAAKQRDSRHLYVETDECLVSVVGTIFSVNHGTKGSRVSVIEGEVHVAQNGEEKILLPGDQIASHVFLGNVPVEKEIAWSRSLDDYLEVLRQYSEIREELGQVTRPDARYSTRLLDLMPEGTVFFASAPNLSTTLTETHRVIEERLAESPELAEWWASEAAGDFQGHLSDLVDTFGELGSFLGDELAVGGRTQDDGELGGIVALIDVLDAAGLRDFIDQQIADNVDADQVDEVYEHLIYVEDPTALSAAADGNNDLFLWLSADQGLGVASPVASDVLRVAALLDGATNPFVGSRFHSEISDRYSDGVEFLVAADLGAVMEQIQDSDDADEAGAHLEAVGVANADLLILEQKRAAGKTHHSAAITFDGERQGVASWLAEPAPMGALDYVSPDAKLVAAVVFKDPVALLDDVYAMAGSGEFSGLASFEEEHQLSLRDDVAASLGGELVIAIDGPMLPKPAWKVILEVYDPARFQWAIEEAIAEANAKLEAAGEEPLALETSELRGRTIYTLPARIMDVHYTFVEGYMVMTADKAFIDQALRFKDSGYSIVTSSKFSALLPPGGENNLSALVYQDLGGVMTSIAERLAEAQGSDMTDEQKAQLDAISGEAEPTLGYAYGESDRITLAASSDGDLVSGVLSRLLGLKNPAGIEQTLETLFGG
ncbi:MAG: FecR family protein [Thermoanaerobaculia bacterium]|nr:FecR family protein [Thermoanaerobaculia bacterium]